MIITLSHAKVKLIADKHKVTMFTICAAPLKPEVEQISTGSAHRQHELIKIEKLAENLILGLLHFFQRSKKTRFALMEK